jgi:hypothetical protein
VIHEGLLEAGISGDQVTTVYSETEAVEHAVQQIREGDLIVILVEDVPAVLQQLRLHRATP